MISHVTRLARRIPKKKNPFWIARDCRFRALLLLLLLLLPISVLSRMKGNLKGTFFFYAFKVKKSSLHDVSAVL